MKKKIAVLTATRAEYGLLKTIIMKLNNVEEFDVKVIVTGAHLSPEFGMTYHEIENDNIKIDRKVEILLSSDTPVSISKSMGLAMISFAEYFEESIPDALIVLGDRYETLAVCCAAMNAQIPIIHLYGGETTEGAIDEAIRHSITKMSYLHFTSTEQYRRRIIQLGEQPERVFCVGAMGVENIHNVKLMSKTALQENIGFSLKNPYAIVTFHSVTLETENAGEQFAEILRAIERNYKLNYIFTKANADANGRVINKMIDDHVSKNENSVAFDSLGQIRYLSALKYASMVIGNSSSGLIEVPSFKIPTINVGDRQRGRIQAESIINCKPAENDVYASMELAMSEEFRNEILEVKNPYGTGNTSDEIIRIIKEYFINSIPGLKKKFYDLNQ